jgi:hypothetical protein
MGQHQVRRRSLRSRSGRGVLFVIAMAIAAMQFPPPVAMADGDTTAPALASFSFSPTTVDTSASAQAITVTAQITDDLAGVEFGAFRFESPSNQSISVYFDSSNRVSGTALDGTYVNNITVPRYSEQGTWTADFFELRDKVERVECGVHLVLVLRRLVMARRSSAASWSRKT